MISLSILLWIQAWPTILFIVGLTTIGLAVIPLLRRPAFPKSTPPVSKHCLPLIGSPDFFTRRAPFVQEGCKASPSGHFSFNYGPLPIIALSGEAARATYFNSRGLDLESGFNAVFAGGPDTSQIFDKDAERNAMAALLKRLLARERLASLLERLISDMHHSMEQLRDSKGSDNYVTIDVFDYFFKSMYQMTHRTLGCNEIANSPGLLASTLQVYRNIDTASAAEIMFPWLPVPSKLKKMWSGYKMFSVLSSIAKERRSGKIDTDAMQVLIDSGNSDTFVTVFIIGALFAGLVNTGFNTSRVLCYLAESPEWRAKCLGEIEATLSKYRQSDSETSADVLPRLKIDDWESGFPSLELCLRESVRLNVPVASVRQNLSGHDIPIAGSSQVIPNGMFATYVFDDLHIDPDIYPDPLVYDPGRYLPGREEDKKVQHGYLGWGVGLHPCPGMKLAKLEITIALVVFMAYFDFTLVDGVGNPRTKPVPTVRRDLPTSEPPIEKVYFKCTPRF